MRTGLRQNDSVPSPTVGLPPAHASTVLWLLTLVLLVQQWRSFHALNTLRPRRHGSGCSDRQPSQPASLGVFALGAELFYTRPLPAVLRQSGEDLLLVARGIHSANRQGDKTLAPRFSVHIPLMRPVKAYGTGCMLGVVRVSLSGTSSSLLDITSRRLNISQRSGG